MVISTFDCIPTLQIRVANPHHQPMVEAEFRLMIVRNGHSGEDDDARRFYSPVMSPADLTSRCRAVESSPLYGVTPEQLEASGSRFLTSMICIDTVNQAPVQSQAG
jgi:hypothetical protein